MTSGIIARPFRLSLVHSHGPNPFPLLLKS